MIKDIYIFDGNGTNMTDPKLILASGSPRRRHLMADLGFECTVVTAGVDETPLPDEWPAELAERLARSKAMAVAGTLDSDGGPYVVLAADTVVGMGQDILGKPEDAEDAVRILRLLRGRRHQVHTAVCVLDVEAFECGARVNTTQVDMRDYSDAEIEEYVASGDPMDKAGAYAIQHPGFAPVQDIEGCITSVMGLPLGDACDLLAEFGLRPQCAIADVCERQADFPCCRREGKN